MIKTEENNGSVHKYTASGCDVGKFVTRKLNRPVIGKEKKFSLNNNYEHDGNRQQISNSTHFNFRKCKLNARNIIDNTIPTTAIVVIVKNASFEIVAKRSLKIRFEMGTTLFSHLIVMQLGQVKSKNSVSG